MTQQPRIKRILRRWRKRAPLRYYARNPKRLLGLRCGYHRRHQFAEWAGLNVAVCKRCGCVYLPDRKRPFRYLGRGCLDRP